jgi:hypothetical protein
VTGAASVDIAKEIARGFAREGAGVVPPISTAYTGLHGPGQDLIRDGEGRVADGNTPNKRPGQSEGEEISGVPPASLTRRAPVGITRGLLCSTRRRPSNPPGGDVPPESPKGAATRSTARSAVDPASTALGWMNPDLRCYSATNGQRVGPSSDPRSPSPPLFKRGRRRGLGT